MKERTKELWNLCFEEEETFTELYFERRYNEDVNIFIEENGQVISALQMLPYPMTFHQHIVDTAYISGACTHPDYRNKGVMKQLLSKAFAKMLERGIPISTLIPASDSLFDYYDRMGFTPTFNYTESVYLTKNLINQSNLTIKEVKHVEPAIYEFFNSKMIERDCCIQHTAKDIEVLEAANQLEEGKIFAGYTNNTIAAVAFTYTKDKEVHVLEIVAQDETIKKAFIQGIAQETDAEKITILEYPQKGKDEKLGMARIIDADYLLRIYANRYPKVELCFSLTDEMVDNNNGTYQIKDGIVSKEDSLESRLKISIQQLTQALIGYQIETLPTELQQFTKQTPYMSLMLD